MWPRISSEGSCAAADRERHLGDGAGGTIAGRGAVRGSVASAAEKETERDACSVPTAEASAPSTTMEPSGWIERREREETGRVGGMYDIGVRK